MAALERDEGLGLCIGRTKPHVHLTTTNRSISLDYGEISSDKGVVTVRLATRHFTRVVFLHVVGNRFGAWRVPEVRSKEIND